MFLQGYVGQSTNRTIAGGASFNLRGGQMGDLVASELQGRFYENTYQNNSYSTGQTAAFSLVAANATATGLTASAQPVLGVYNPTTSTMNLALQQLALQEYLNNVTSVALGAWVIVTSTGNGAVSTGLTPFNRKTLAAAGSQAKGFAGATALTGLTNSLVVQESIEIPQSSGLLTTTVAAATPTPSAGATINLDGQWLVPPGGFWGIMNTLATTTHTVYGRLFWNEVPI